MVAEQVSEKPIKKLPKKSPAGATRKVPKGPSAEAQKSSTKLSGKLSGVFSEKLSAIVAKKKAKASTKKPQAERIQSLQEENTKKAVPLPSLAFFKKLDWATFRFRSISFFFIFAFSIIWLRMAYLQLWEGSFLAAGAKRQHLVSEVITKPRGIITDRNGYILARSVRIRSVSADPRLVEDIDKYTEILSGILDSSPEYIHKQLSRKKAFSWLQRKVTDAQALEIQEADLPGIMLNKEYERVYPYKQVAGQLLGFVGIDGNGLEGLELAYDKTLSSLSTREISQRDAMGRRLYVDNKADTQTNHDIRLSLDMQVQFIAEEVLAEAVSEVDAKWGGALVVDVKSGEILAWAQFPFFNPNNFRKSNPALYKNRLALDAIEHGSTLKPLVVAAALQESVITKNSVFNCEDGVWETEHITIGDDGRAYGDLSVNQILSYSSNIGIAKIGLELGTRRFHHSLRTLGFGQRTHLNLAESKGILHSPQKWSESDLMAAAFGQSMAATTLQMAQAYLTLANKGLFRPIRLNMSDAYNDGGNQRIFSEKTAQDVLLMMQEVVDYGTGRRAAIKGIDVAGKTGTAQKADNTGKYGYGDGRVGSFVGIFPAKDPEFLVITIFDEPKSNQYGGVIAAPVFKEIATRLLAYQGNVPSNVPGAIVDKDLLYTEKNQRMQREPKGLPLVQGEYRNALKTTQRQKKALVHGAVPNVVGKSLRYAIELYAEQGLVPIMRGNGNVVVKQIPPAGYKWTEAEKESGECIIWLSEPLEDTKVITTTSQDIAL